MERCFLYHRTQEASTVDIAIIHLGREAAQWYDWDNFFLKCYIPLNPSWLLMRHSQISSDFHDFPQDRTMMLKVFPDDDLQSTTQDRKKIESLQ
ncbi:hypothetical protein BHE74_00028102 [Ensete ventricosum]|nr:hypothetical protein BHE74_00028102 [Ensete ventricosum]